MRRDLIACNDDVRSVRAELEIAKAKLEFVNDFGVYETFPSEISIMHPKLVHDTAILQLQTVLTGMSRDAVCSATYLPIEPTAMR
jgi:hypothetical protein